MIFSYYERYQKEKLKASQIEAQLSNARLQALKMQLHPHFLFNTLHSISALVLKNENRDAVKMINRLSELLRLTLDNIETQIVSLEDEIEFARRYLEIEGIRFRDRLSVEWEIEPQTLKARVPNLILQPLAENAVQHGIAPLEEGGQITISAERQNGNLLLQVSDNGEGFAFRDDEKIGGGIGLSNTRARLESLYREAHKFLIEEQTNGAGVIVKMEIPFREQIREKQ